MRLREQITNIENVLRLESFDEALRLLNDLLSDDSASEFDISNRVIIIRNRYLQPMTISEIMHQVSEHTKDIEIMHQWLLPMVKVVPWQSTIKVVNPPPDRQTDLNKVLEFQIGRAHD